MKWVKTDETATCPKWVLLAAAGFTNVWQIIDGMEVDAVKDPDSVFQGQRLKNGWKNSGLPWTYQPDPERMRFVSTQAKE